MSEEVAKQEPKKGLELSPGQLFYGTIFVASIAAGWLGYETWLDGNYTEIPRPDGAHTLWQDQDMNAFQGYGPDSQIITVIDSGSENYLKDVSATCNASFPSNTETIKRGDCENMLGPLSRPWMTMASGPSVMFPPSLNNAEDIRRVLENIELADRYTFEEMKEHATIGAYVLGGVVLLTTLGWAGKEAAKLRRAKFVAKQQKREASKRAGIEKRKSKKNPPTPADTYDHLTDGYVAPSSQVSHEQAANVAAAVHPDTAQSYTNATKQRIELIKLLMQLKGKVRYATTGVLDVVQQYTQETGDKGPENLLINKLPPRK